jgi:DNA-binding GntR family transcriptional regulator
VQSIELYMRLSLPVRANSMADKASLRVSHEHHRLMIEMLKGRDNWVLAQLCVDHLQPSKRNYLAHVS